MKTLCKILTGSHLYGLNTEASDRDYRGVFLPSLDDLILERAPKTISLSTGNNQSKNNSEDEDYQAFSLQNFVRLGLKGEMNIMDMLHAPKQFWIESSPEWEFIHANRFKMHSKVMDGYLRFSLSNANKYSNRGSRMRETEELVSILKQLPLDSKLADHWDKLPTGKYRAFTIDERGFEMYECCGRKVHKTVSVSFALDIYNVYLENYGERARLAKEGGIDNKAVSHAFRALIQVEQLLNTGDIVFPLVDDREFLMKIKLGQYGDSPDYILDLLSDRIDDVKQKLDNSSLPDKVDRKFWENYILELYK